MKIHYTNWGIASRIGDDILLNKALKLYPTLHDTVLAHEKKHTGEFTWEDLRHDIFSNTNLLGFCIKHPKAFTQMLPISIWKGSLSIDANLLAIYGIITLLVIFIASHL